MRYRYILIAILILSAGIFLAYRRMKRNENAQDSRSAETEKVIRYLPLGDSYTIGTGISETDNWPNQLVKMLGDSGVKISLIANPARNGFTTQDLIDKELPLLDKTMPDFVTILIGVNDWVRGIGKPLFEKNLHGIIETVQKKMGPSAKNILLVTIPDFGLTPSGKQYGGGRDISKGIDEFNDVIIAAGKKYNLSVADINPVSKEFVRDPSLTAADGLHPSGKGYAEWLKIIYPLSKKILQ